jgi:hypothetical protein
MAFLHYLHDQRPGGRPAFIIAGIEACPQILGCDMDNGGWHDDARP